MEMREKTPYVPPRRVPAAEIKAGLDRLIEHQFITGWHRFGRLYYVNAGALFGPYSQQQAAAFVDGAQAMGAG